MVDELIGPCCACGLTRNVRNVIMLDKRAPIAGTGWGCVVCGLPSDGAVAVVCDDCLDEEAPLKFICKGYASQGDRAPIETATEPFGHDLALHRLAFSSGFFGVSCL